MTNQEIKQLVPEQSYVRFANADYKVAEITTRLGTPFIGIYDEPPSQHVDYINASSCETSKRKDRN